MQEHYQIRPSIVQLYALISSYLVVGVIIFYCIEPGLVKWATLASVILLLISETRCLIQQKIIFLQLHPGTDMISFKADEQPYFYPKYKVYQTRWFAILKLVNENNSRILILNPDRFSSIQKYRHLRYSLRKMEHRHVA